MRALSPSKPAAVNIVSAAPPAAWAREAAAARSGVTRIVNDGEGGLSCVDLRTLLRLRS
jgi:hypothetical protein